jgi:hypothetical protein
MSSYIYNIIRSSGENITVFIFITTIARQIIAIKFVDNLFKRASFSQILTYFLVAMVILQPPSLLHWT